MKTNRCGIACFPLIVCLVGCASWVDPSASGAPPAPVGRLVDIGGRSIHVHSTGRGKPTVVLIPGAGDYSFDWAKVQAAASRTALVVSYDRAGSAWSDTGTAARTMRQEAHELRLALAAGGFEPPFVLVGHSVGGLVARVFARSFPDTVAGVVLVDATHEDTVLSRKGKVVRIREQAGDRAVPPVQTPPFEPPPSRSAAIHAQSGPQETPPNRGKLAPPYDQLPVWAQRLRQWFVAHPGVAVAGDDFWAEELRDLHQTRKNMPHELGDLPLVALAGTRGWDRVQADPVREQLRLEKQAQKMDLANLSRRGRFVAVPAAGHHIHLDAPDAVVRAIREVMLAARSRPDGEP